MSILTRIRDALSPEFVSGERSSAVVPTDQRYAGGPINMLAGMGGASDKGNATIWTPTIEIVRSVLEVVYVESWAAGRFINMPVDDMFIRGRSWIDEDEAAIEAIREASNELRCEVMLSTAMKAGRLHGTGLLLIITGEAAIDTPLDMQKLKEGDFKSLLAFDQYDASVKSHYSDIASPKYGMPEIYTISPRCAGDDVKEFDIHESRTLRFDGIRPLSSDGWSAGYHNPWGVSELIPALKEIGHDAGMTGAISYLIHEASIPYVKLEGFADSVQGNVAKDEVKPDQIGTRMSVLKSIYRMMFLDATSDFGRVAVNFGSLPELMDKYAARLAAIAGIPATRFLSQAPAGLNSTGESDMKNYAMKVAALQMRVLTEPLAKLDGIIARHIGLAKPLDYVWNPLIEMSDLDRAEVSKKRAEALNVPLMSGVIDENEWRERMTDVGDDLFGKLEALDEAELLARRPDPADPGGGDDGDGGGDDGDGDGDE